jgi:hypothetical protein
MKRGFELLKTRSLNEKIDFKSLEAKYGINIPPLYRMFLNMFYIGEDSIYFDKYYSDEYKDFFPCSDFFYEPDRDKVMFTGFLSIENSLEIRSTAYEGDEVFSKGLIPIGHTASNSAIHIGTQGEEVDKIIFDSDSPGRFENLGINIFEFMQHIVLKPLPREDIIGRVDQSQLYRNWNEEFWRVKSI